MSSDKNILERFQLAWTYKIRTARITIRWLGSGLGDGYHFVSVKQFYLDLIAQYSHDNNYKQTQNLTSSNSL